MTKIVLNTYFAPPERASDQDLIDQRAALERQSLIKALLDAIPEFVVVLNRCRQIIMANQSMTDLLGLAEDKPLVGLRPGEALDCIHAGAGPAGCGTSEFCRTCGAVQAILRSFAIGRDIQSGGWKPPWNSWSGPPSSK
jgi:PAS domain-containing protein